MLRPLPPHSSLAEDVWIYSGMVAFERNKWEGGFFLLQYPPVVSVAVMLFNMEPRNESRG